MCRRSLPAWQSRRATSDVPWIVLAAPFALDTGILALRDIKSHPEKAGRGRAIFGIVMGAGTIILLLVLS